MGARKESAATGASQGHRWLFIDGASAFGGHEVMLLRWLEELAAQRAAQCFVLARSESELARAAARHATVLELPGQRTGKFQGALGTVRDIAAMIRAVIGVRPQLCVIAEGCLLAQPLFVVLARLLRRRVVIYVPLVQTSVSMGFGSAPLRDALVRRCYAHLPHAWITITQEQAQHFRAWARVRRPIFVLPNTISTAIESRGRRASSGPSARPEHARLRILVLGRIEAHQKGLDILMDFLAAHPELGARMSVSLTGSGPYESEVRARLAQDAALASWVSLQPWSQTAEALCAHDTLLMTSRYEGVPLVMLEAMALGVPVVAPDLDGTRAFLHHSDLFPREDMEAAFRRVERMADPLTRQVSAQRNRAAFEASAANATFSAAVKSLTPKLEQLASASLRGRSA